MDGQRGGRWRTVLSWTALTLAVVVAIVAASMLRPIGTMVAFRILNQLPSSGGPPVAVETADLSGSEPGSLISATTMPGVTRTIEGRALRAARVVYRSTSGDTSEPTVVSGSVFTPRGDAPADGWPVVAFGHGTLGIDGQCGPSTSPTLLNLVNVVRVLVRLGYAVALPDYQGLGTKGVHPYSDARTAGLNMIDAVRALRRTFDGVSQRWAALGDSQGGAAAWAADEQARAYAPELRLVGALASSPAADISGLVNKAQQGTLTGEQRPVMQLVVESLARLHPDLNRDDYRRGAAAHYWNVLTDCSESAAYQRGTASAKLGPRDFTPSTAEAADRLRRLLQDWALPQEPLAAPLYVWYGGKDPYIDSAWTAAAVERACAMGGVVTVHFDPEGGHNPANALGMLDWMAERFDGKPAPNDCS
ncbi:lipase family protein [Mycobacterium deserti]|uniref:Lipase family protein n=1 Tax=Mycobacterium deserti TaxID=2978347 RepID=A0ABT2MF49_9MYCO|nr:lipase family protein [Mycobacterium deserti]MCT7660902.1 lipase family protein [Mycobacterium deserti]